MLRKLERLIEPHAVENMTLYIVALTAIVSLASITMPELGLISLDRLMAGQWWNLIFFPFRISGHPIFLLFYLYFFWIFGSVLEAEMGAARYNLYIYLSLPFVILGGLLFPLQVDGRFIDLSVFIACAYLVPNMVVNLYMILPIRIKWIALFMILFEFYNALELSLTFSTYLPMLAPFVGAGNFLVYFGPSLITQVKRDSANYKRRQKFHVVQSTRESVHRCTVCGLTELDDPNMDFRYCVSCRDHEYCRNHLYNHEHID